MDFWNALWLKISSKIDDGFLTAMGIITTVIIAYLKRIPKKIMHQYRRRRQLSDIEKGSKINNIVRRLKITGAIYIHIIKYHNGGPYKMTVEWEAVGDPCNTCDKKCAHFRNGIHSLQKHWIDQKVTNTWAHVIGRTLQLDGALNTFHIDDFDKLQKKMEDIAPLDPQEVATQKSIFKMANIRMFKEVLLIMDGKNSFTLALSYCSHFETTDETDLDQLMAARLLRKLLY